MKDSLSAADLSAAIFRKSSFSGGGGNECVEVALVSRWTCVRDSKDPAGPVLTASPSAFDSFLDAVKSDGFDL